MSRFDNPGQPSFALPRVGPALKAVLATIAAVGIVESILVAYVPGGQAYFKALACSRDAIEHGQIWRLFTAGLLTSPTSMGHLIFTLIGLYFLSPELEKTWGTWRFIRFLLISVALGFLLTIGVDIISGSAGPSFFHPPIMFGAGAAITGVAIAWSEMHKNSQVQLFFFLPMSGRILFWVTIGFCTLGLVYPASVPEGAPAPFAGVLTGILMGGTPSLLRTLWLRLKLVFLRRQGAAANVRPLLRDPKKRPPNAPPLRVVRGGLIQKDAPDDDDEKKRPPPKDKRYLN
ncbi:MAG: rhomboid family intramembrane serine protease [Polyangiaceae bacterium]